MNDQTTGLVLRELSGVAELKRAEQFQKTVWGEDDPPDNSDIMLAIQHEGGLVAGARGGRSQFRVCFVVVGKIVSCDWKISFENRTTFLFIW